MIAEHYNRKISRETGRSPLVLGSEVQDALMAHSWPGNVRELRNAVASVMYLAKSRHVTCADLPCGLTDPPPSPDARYGLVAHDTRLAGSESLRQAEALLIGNSLVLNRGNMSKAAISLGISRPTLYRKMQHHGITVAETKPKLA